MSKPRHNNLPDPSRDSVNAWMHDIDPEYLHETGWVEVNARAHRLAMGGRRFTNAYFPEDAQRRADFIDGVTFGLLGVMHAADVEKLRNELYALGDHEENTGTKETTGINAECVGGEDQIPAV